MFTKYRDPKWLIDPRVLHRDPDHHLNPEEEVIESNEELPSSEHDEDHKSIFSPPSCSASTTKSNRQPPVVAGMYMPILKVHAWIGQLMIICITDFSNGTLNVKTF